MINTTTAIDNLLHPQGCDESDIKATIEYAIKALKFKSYFDQLYGEGLEVANWHLNGDLEPFDNFYDSACQGEIESTIQELKDLKTKLVQKMDELHRKNTQLKFLEQGFELTEKYNISRDTASCYICNFEDDYICKQFNGGCKNLNLCRDIYLKQLEESAF